jgi:hypothetical protein
MGTQKTLVILALVVALGLVAIETVDLMLTMQVEAEDARLGLVLASHSTQVKEDASVISNY